LLSGSRLRNKLVHSPPATITMQTIGEALGLVVGGLSDQNYSQSLDFYRFWLGTGQGYVQVPSDQIFDAIWNNRVASSIQPNGGIFHSSAHLIPRFASDAVSDRILGPYSSELQSRLCARSLREFSSNNLMVARYGRDTVREFYADANLIAHWANLGYVEEAAIRDHILQSLISHPKLYDHQADALIILFKLAGATFGAYADPSVIDRCFELLTGHNYHPPWNSGYHCDGPNNTSYLQVKRGLVQVSVPRAEKCGSKTQESFSGGSCVTRAWVGGSSSPTCIRVRAAKTEAGRSRRNSSCYVPRTSPQRSRTPDNPGLTTRTSHCPRDGYDSCIRRYPRHPVTVHQHLYFVRLHDCRCF